MNRSEFKQMLNNTGCFKTEEIMLIMSAYDYSKAAHRNQEREEFPESAPIKDKRYFNHPRRLAINMLEAGIRDVNTICIALLHDCPEDTSIFGNQHIDGYEQAMRDAEFRLKRAFNSSVAKGVISLTIPNKDEKVEIFSSKTKCLTYYHNKLSKASFRALIAKLFDRLDNLSSIEVKGLKTAQLKLAETSDFYIPLFQNSFCECSDKTLKNICFKKLGELEELVSSKSVLI